MKPYKTYVVGSNLYTYGDGHTHKTTLEMDDAVVSCATIDHICLLDSHGVATYGNIDKEGRVTLPKKASHTLDGPWTMMASMPNRMFLLSIKGNIFEIVCGALSVIGYDGNYQKIACGANFLIALDTNGVASRYGDLEEIRYERPMQFHNGVVDIVCGDYHCILLQEDGQAVCYGEDEYRFDPVDNVVKIYAAGKSSLLTGTNFSKYYGGKHGK